MAETSSEHHFFFPSSWPFVTIHEAMESKSTTDSSWPWNPNNNQQNQFSITKILGTKPQKPQTSLLGPGFGAGFGCGAGIGFGLLGGFGYGGGGGPFNHLNLVFGLGMGCGLGIGYGFGQGIGYSFDYQTRKSAKSRKSFSDTNKTIVFQL